MTVGRPACGRSVRCGLLPLVMWLWWRLEEWVLMVLLLVDLAGDGSNLFLEFCVVGHATLVSIQYTAYI